MDAETILSILKELTLDFVNGKRNRSNTVIALHERINPDDIYKMADTIPQKDFITEVYVSLDNLTEEGFAPSLAEMNYFAECFEGQRTFSREEVRKFPIGSYERQNP
jgi:hypothetical protein